MNNASVRLKEKHRSFESRIVVVGLPDAAVQESRERVQSAIKNSGFSLPRHRVTVNLAPAAVRKEGPAYDLPIAVGMLIATGQLGPDTVDGSLIVGELSLDGGVRHVRGMLPMAALAKEAGIQHVFAPEMDAAEAALIPELEVYPVASLGDLHAHLTGGLPIPAYEHTAPEDLPISSTITDYQHIKGQEQVKRALEVLRQPLEDKQVTISRAQGSLTFPSNFQLIAAMNPWACSSV